MRPRQGLRAALAIVLVVAAGTAGMLAGSARDGPARAAPGLRADLLPRDLDGAAAPRIRLRDATGRLVDSARLRGRPFLVAFVYTHCIDVCPLIGSEIADAFDRLGGAAPGAAALAVSVDPRGDTPATARRWLAKHGLPRETRYLVGTRAELTPVWRDWFVVPRDGTLADPRAHDVSVWLVDARGRLRGRWSGAEGIDPADVAHDLRALIAEGH
jgi:protein SCO1/2